MKLPRFAVAVDAVPIEESVRRVAGLLNLGDQEAGAERVHRARFEKDAIADLRLELMEAIVAGAGGELAFERAAVDARSQARIDFAPRFRGQHDPGFRLAEVGRRKHRALSVVRVHLHRERELGVEEFQQQRELRLRMAAAEEFGAVFGD